MPVNVQHPYGYPIAIALLSIAAFFLICAYKQLDDLLEERRMRRLDQAADCEQIKQRLAGIPDQRQPTDG
jgi:hypothetical protein